MTTRRKHDNSHDRDGRPYVRYADLKAGDTVWLDGGFDCHPPGPVTIVVDEAENCFRCKAGFHGLRAQCDDGVHCVGVYASDPGPMEWQAKPEAA